jgi:hypothetical protein
MLLPSCRIGRSCCTKERRAQVDGEETIEILDGVVLDRGGLRGAGIGDEDVKAIADDGANLLGKPVGTVRRGEIGGDDIGAAAGLADCRNDGFRLLRAARAMNEHLGAGLRAPVRWRGRCRARRL